MITTEDGTPVDLSSLPPMPNRTRRQNLSGNEGIGRELPATFAQVGALNGELARLGFRTYDDDEDNWLYNLLPDDEKAQRRATNHSARLELCSRLTGREIASTKELTRGEAGKLVKMLTGCDTPSDLLALSPAEKT